MRLDGHSDCTYLGFRESANRLLLGARSGRKKEALNEISRALDTDPLSLQINTASIQVNYFVGDYDRAIECGLKTLDLDASFSTARIFLAMAYQKKKMFLKALIGRWESRRLRCS
jgi:tetratricopeptide (TPR) repeat protein